MFSQDIKVAIYRCLIGDYDTVLDELETVPGADYYLFTDNPDLVVRPYKTITIESEYSSPALTNRQIKIEVPKILDRYDVTLYADANIAIVGAVGRLIGEFIDSGADIGLFRHPYSSTLNEEAVHCIESGKVSESDVLQEFEYYSAEKITLRNPLSDNSVILRRKISDEMRDAMSYWFCLVRTFTARDQLSLPAVRSKYNLNEYFFDFSPRTRGNEYFIVFPHRKNISLIGYLGYAEYSARLCYKHFKRYFAYLKRSLVPDSI